MGLTLSDRHKMIYTKWRDEGLSHKKALKRVPKKLRKQFKEDITKTPIESHFGLKDRIFYRLMISMILGSIIFVTYTLTTFNQ